MDQHRRAVIAGAALMGAVGIVPAKAAPARPPLDPIPPLPVKPTPGRPGDFDFLTGEWHIQNWQSRRPDDWIEFEGAATVTGILEGVCSIEELRIPARNFSGMGLRLLDREKQVWSDFWVNARQGVLTTPGQTGSFENGAGIFVTDDIDNGTPVKYVGVWDKITPNSCRWRQASSRDGGQEWLQNWIMHWTRVK